MTKIDTLLRSLHKLGQHARLCPAPTSHQLTVRQFLHRLEEGFPMTLACACTRIEPHEAPLAGSLSRAALHARVQVLDYDEQLVLYCVGCENEYCARWVAATLRSGGFTRARVLVGGADAWVEAGLPLQRHKSD